MRNDGVLDRAGGGRWFSRTRGLGGETKRELSWGWDRKESRTRWKRLPG